MKITYFIRNNNNIYNEFCDKASIRLLKNEQTFYAGVQWGEYTPTDTLHYICVNCDEMGYLQLYPWAESLGFQVIEEENPQ